MNNLFNIGHQRNEIFDPQIPWVNFAEARRTFVCGGMQFFRVARQQ
jgi:hypothetical protein